MRSRNSKGHAIYIYTVLKIKWTTNDLQNTTQTEQYKPRMNPGVCAPEGLAVPVLLVVLDVLLLL
jgi:hypothetical protein